MDRIDESDRAINASLVKKNNFSHCSEYRWTDFPISAMYFWRTSVNKSNDEDWMPCQPMLLLQWPTTTFKMSWANIPLIFLETNQVELIHYTEIQLRKYSIDYHFITITQTLTNETQELPRQNQQPFTVWACVCFALSLPFLLALSVQFQCSTGANFLGSATRDASSLAK